MANENRTYKDSLFCDLFYSDRDAKANLLSLYNALYGTDYTDESMIEEVRLEDVLFRNMKNDIAFQVGDRQIILGEHQSTPCANIPLRSLMYVAREYERLIPEKARYRSRLVKIPRPEFYTFYNGEVNRPSEMELRLSDAFKASEVSQEDKPKLELIVKMININLAKKNPLLVNCRVMGEYSQFVEEVRRHKGDKRALEQSVRRCIAEGILADYLSRKGSEVVNMLMAEYDYDMDMAVQREEAAEEAEERGRELGRAEGMELGRAEGMELGRAEGMELGRSEGIELMKKALKLHAQGKSAEEIAGILEIPVEQVQLMLS